MSVGAVVVAAGRGERLGEPGPKALVTLAGRALLLHALDALDGAGLPPAVVVHTPGEEVAFTEALGERDIAALVPGGHTRTDSVRAGVRALGPEPTVVAVHDAARPLMPPAVIRRAVDAVRGDVVAAAPALAVTDTLKRLGGDLDEDGSAVVLGSLDRAGIAGVQTPQVFHRAALEQALDADVSATDDLSLVERLVADGALSGRVVVVAGSSRGMKITYPDDLLLATAVHDALLHRQAGAP